MKKIKITDPSDHFVSDDEYTFENYYVGPSNQNAWTYLGHVAETWPIENHGPIVLTGTTGFGKTHLTTALTNKLKRKLSDLRIARTSTERFIYQLTAVMRSGSLGTFIANRRFDVFVVEAVQVFASATPEIQVEALKFFRQFLADPERLVIFDVDRPLIEVKGLSPELGTIFTEATQLRLQAPSSDQVEAFVRGKCFEIFGMAAPEELVEYVAFEAKSSPRTVLGLINIIDLHRDVLGEARTLATAKTFLIEFRESRLGRH